MNPPPRPHPTRRTHRLPYPRRQPGAGHRPPSWRWLAAVSAALVGLTACGTAPAPQLFSLLPAATATVLGGAPSPAPVPAGPAGSAGTAVLAVSAAQAVPAAPSTLPPLAVALGPVAVPVPVDQPQWLVQLPDQRLVLLEQALWASPLRDELRSALRELLARRWALTDGQPPAWRLTLVLSRFESALGQAARLAGHWTLLPGAAATAAGATLISCPLWIYEPAGAGLPALAEAHRRALVRLSDQIGAALRQPPPAPGPSCPAPDA